MDWIEESLKLLSIEQNCLPEPLTSINIQFLYINKENELESTKKMEYKIADSKKCITKEEVLELVLQGNYGFNKVDIEKMSKDGLVKVANILR